MARRKRGFKIFLWLVLLGALAWAGFKYYDDLAVYLRPQPKVRDIGSETGETSRVPLGFPLKNLKEKELDLNRDGKKEILITSFADGAPRAVLVDASSPEKTLSQVFDFSLPSDSPESEFKSEDTPEVFETIDLNRDGAEEIILDLKDYGANTDSFGVLVFKSGKLEWVILQEADGSRRPAIFRDGASVKHASVFKILEGSPKALAQIVGEEGADGNWAWEAEAYQWNGEGYAYNETLSRKILQEQPVF